ncbi:hypothetical protein FOZ62_029518, partial [Perkinsus olseni]
VCSMVNAFPRPLKSSDKSSLHRRGRGGLPPPLASPRRLFFALMCILSLAVAAAAEEEGGDRRLDHHHHQHDGGQDAASIMSRLTGAGSTSFFGGFLSSFLMIICAELGDKTFFIAAILSMRHSAVVVFMGAIIAMATMTVLSAGLGLLLPALLSKKVTHYSCIVLFVYFGLRLLKDAYDSDNGDSGDLAEVEMSIKKKYEEHDKSAAEEQEAQIEAGEAAAVEDV